MTITKITVRMTKMEMLTVRMTITKMTMRMTKMEMMTRLQTWLNQPESPAASSPSPPRHNSGTSGGRDQHILYRYNGSSRKIRNSTCMNEAMLCLVPSDDSIPRNRSLVLKIRIICLGGGGRVMRGLMMRMINMHSPSPIDQI